MGLNDQEIVALSGAHTLGRAYKQRSGLPSMNETIYTEHGPGTRGGMSWTRDWLAFDNAYYVELKKAKEAGEVREVSPPLSLSRFHQNPPRSSIDRSIHPSILTDATHSVLAGSES